MMVVLDFSMAIAFVLRNESTDDADAMLDGLGQSVVL